LCGFLLLSRFLIGKAVVPDWSMDVLSIFTVSCHAFPKSFGKSQALKLTIFAGTIMGPLTSLVAGRYHEAAFSVYNRKCNAAGRISMMAGLTSSRHPRITRLKTSVVAICGYDSAH
jgi:hypothetical protein